MTNSDKPLRHPALDDVGQLDAHALIGHMLHLAQVTPVAARIPMHCYLAVITSAYAEWEIHTSCMRDDSTTQPLLQRVGALNLSSREADNRIHQLAQACFITAEHALLTGDVSPLRDIFARAAQQWTREQDGSVYDSQSENVSTTRYWWEDDVQLQDALRTLRHIGTSQQLAVEHITPAVTISTDPAPHDRTTQAHCANRTRRTMLAPDWINPTDPSHTRLSIYEVNDIMVSMPNYHAHAIDWTKYAVDADTWMMGSEPTHLSAASRRRSAYLHCVPTGLFGSAPIYQYLRHTTAEWFYDVPTPTTTLISHEHRLSVSNGGTHNIHYGVNQSCKYETELSLPSIHHAYMAEHDLHAPETGVLGGSSADGNEGMSAATPQLPNDESEDGPTVDSDDGDPLA